MQRINAFIADKTYGESFKTNKYSLDHDSKSIIDYEEAYKTTPTGHGETTRSTEPIDLSDKAKRLQNGYSLFKYFLDGLRRTYRVNDVNKLNIVERHEFIEYIKNNIFDKNIYNSIKNEKIKRVYKHYLLSRDEILDQSTKIGKLKIKYDLNHIKQIQ